MPITAEQIRAFADRPWAKIEARSRDSMVTGMSREQRLVASCAIATLHRERSGAGTGEDLQRYLTLAQLWQSVRAGSVPG